KDAATEGVRCKRRAIGFADETVSERCAVMGGIGPHLGVVTGVQGADFAILEVRRAQAPDKVGVALDEAIPEIGGVAGIIDEQRVLIAGEEDIGEDQS